MRKLILLIGLGVVLSASPAHALIPNGDFEKGNLDGYFVQEDFSDVPSSPLVTAAVVAPGETVGQIDTGYTQYGVTTATLARDFGTLPADVQDLLFDVKFIDQGPDDDGGIFALQAAPELLALEALDPDTLFVSFGSSSNPNALPDFFTLSATGSTNGAGTQVEALSNGFYRVRTNISSLASSNDNALYFDFRDGDDQRLSRVQVDNIDLTTLNSSVAPEPATMLLMAGGLLGAGFMRKKKIV
ncbi:MAG: PEP-CTERM sorting domain-containing protein [Candidatus Omnitrophica bacterium]|nr:PEP-CTERM sorting domain-containing protein [Candidatus Omnitrophota bacterium]